MNYTLVNPSVEIISMTPTPLKIIERAARTCYKSESKIKDGSDVELITRLIKMGHDAMLEFADVHFLIVCDRGISHELVRHRIASYAQESTRYCNYLKTSIQIIDMRKYFVKDLDYLLYDSWLNSINVSSQIYLYMIEKGISPQIARSVLPNALKTEINVKMNFRSLRNFFKLRLSKAAHPQMREIAKMMLEKVREKVPIIFDEF